MAKDNTKPTAMQELKNAIREKKLKRLYFFYGEEVFLLHHYLDQIRNLLIDPLTESFNFHKLTVETFSVQALSEAVENLPMMAENTFVWVDEIDIFKLSEPDREFLAAVFRDIPDYCTVVFTYETTPWKPDKRLKKFYDAVSQNGTEVSFDKQDQRDLITWVTRHFAAEKKQITPFLCTHLIELTGGSMVALSSEIKKICAFAASDVITQFDIDSVTEPVLDAVIFQISDSIVQRQYGVALKKLRELFQMQQDPLLILGGIGGHFRRISTAITLQENGKGYQELQELYPTVRDYAARKTMSAAKNFSHRFCERAAELVLQTDTELKTSRDEPLRLLEMLVIQLGQEAKIG